MSTANQPFSRRTTGMLRLAKQTAVVCAVAVLFILILLGIATAIDVLLMAFMGLLFAIFLLTIADLLKRYTGLNATWSLVAVVLFLLLALVVIGWLLVPTISSQLQEFQQKLPASISSLRERLNATPWGSWMVQQIPETGKSWPQAQAAITKAAGIVSTAIGGLGIPLIVFFVGLMLAAQPQLYRKGFLRLVPPARRRRAADILKQIGSTLRWWLIAKFTAMVIIGLLTWLGLLFLGVELAATLAVLAAVLTFIPNFGPIISAIPAVLLALMQGPYTALWVVLLYIVTQLLESYVITPLIQYRALSLPPVLVIVAQLAASVWVGILGLALATPLLAIVVVLVRTLYVEDILGEGSETAAVDAQGS